ncbi:MAG TPA: TonB-dependent receptor, partial [Adhaeribacter sp.]|nr:TonB-dependent receptor [Adhaeribacter sp.]
LPNTWAPMQGSASPDLRLSLGLTRRMNIGSAQISNISALTYSNTRQTMVVERDRYLQFDGTSSQKEFSYADVQSNQNVRLGLVHNWAVRLNENHKIEFRNLFNQLGSSEVVLREGTDFTKNIDIQSTALRYESRGIYSGQLQGTHDLNQQRSQFTWTTGYSRTSRNEPDFRRLRNQRESGTEEPFLLVVPFNPDPQQVGRFYSKLNENIYMAGSQFEHGLGKQDSVTGETKIKVRAGFYAEHKARDFNARWMSYIKGNASQFDESIRTLPVDQIFQPENINPVTGFKLAEGTNPSDRYQASNDLLAAYAGASAPLTDNFSIAGGVRVEHNIQQLSSAKYGGEEVEVNNPITSVLPSLNLTYNLSPRTLLRSSNSISVNRPEFRELAPFSYYDFQLNSEIKGNPELQTATIYATDLRYEFYPNPTEAISFGVFYKQFRNPIESVILPTSENPIFSFANAEFAQSYGLETEVRKSLLDVSENRIIQNMSLVLNASVIKSKVDMGEEVSETQDRNRAMMGQSPYIVNTGIYYQDDERNLQVNLLYNIIGKRIFLVGNFLNPTVYEMPRHAIDLSVSKRVGQRLEIKAGIQDLLNQKIRLTQDSNQDGKITGIDENIANYRRGAYSSMGISYKF